MHARHAEQRGTSGRVLHSARLYDIGSWLLFLGRENRFRQATVEMAGIVPGEAVLDVGCGTGSLTLAAKRAAGPGAVVAGIDPSPEMIERAKQKAAKAGVEVDFRVAAIEALPFDDAMFDVVLSSLMLHHLPDEVKRRGFAEAARVLRPGGRFFAIDMAPGSHGLLGHLFGGFIRRHAGDGIESSAPLLEAAGFHDVRTAPSRFGPLMTLQARRGPAS
jgi:ubiquinone/menaquinone biosynthesis C-methylase UbiE